MIGRQISHYRLVAELGSGSMGTVYRAEDTRLGREVAVKVAHASLSADPIGRVRLQREAEVGLVLDHPNIARLYEVGEADGVVFLAMEYVAGSTLRDVLRAPMPPARVIAIGRALAEALDHAHQRDIVHLDVKPENVMVSPGGQVKLTDFGTAHVAGAITGTFPYVAPELISGADPDARSDLYALGITVYELCVGTPPFHGTPAEMLRRVASEPPPALPVGVPSPLAELITRMIDKDPASRPASAAETAGALAAMQPAGAA